MQAGRVDLLLSHYLKDFRRPAARVALEHHERRDGSGYPRGIRLRNRLVEIVVACDVYDALISARPYRRNPYDNRTALEEISDTADRGSLDLGIVKALVSHNRKGRPDPRACKVSAVRRGKPPDNNQYGILLEDELTAGDVPVYVAPCSARIARSPRISRSTPSTAVSIERDP